MDNQTQKHLRGLLNADELVDIDADIATNNSQPLTVEEIVNDFNNKLHTESDNAEW